ncbi:hypothetical protein [Kitasatospora sp. NPDC001683]
MTEYAVLADRLRRVNLEVTNEQRREWFFDHLWSWGKVDSWSLPFAMGMISRFLKEAKANGYPKKPKPRPKRYRIVRGVLGQVLEEIQDDEPE